MTFLHSSTCPQQFPYLFLVRWLCHLPLSFIPLFITCQRGHSLFHLFYLRVSDLWLIYAYWFSFSLSCTIFRLITIVAGPFQAFLVFNHGYVRLPSPRLDLLYQYQAIASEVPHDQNTTNSFTCEPSILRPIAWLHQIPLSHTRPHDFVHLETWQAGLTDMWLTLTWLSLLIRIQLWLCLELGCNRYSLELDRPSNI